MERAFDSQLDDLKRQILIMGGHVEKALAEVSAGLLHRDPSKFQLVHEIEKKINEEHIGVDNTCVQLLAKQGPVAKDLRFILSVIKINTDLERMGDQAVNIAYTGKDYLTRPALNYSSEIAKMSEIVKKMVKDSLDCFVRGDVELARKVLSEDDQVDEMKDTCYEKLMTHMKQHSNDVEAAMDLIFVARNLERLGDHATNIAEDVIYAMTGKDIRHGGKYS